MALAIFPAYGIARLVVCRPGRSSPAVATIAAPALSYAPILVEEPFAYPVATLALYLIVRAVARPVVADARARRGGVRSRGRDPLAARRARRRLRPLPARARLADGADAALARRRGRASDWVGAVVLAVGAVLAFSAFMGHHSQEWATTTAFWKGRIVDYGVWAVGALAIGFGVLPLVATLAALVRPRADWRDPGLRAFGIVTRRARLVLLVRGGEGRLPVDHLLEPRRRAEPDLPLPAALHRHGPAVRAARRALVGGRPRGCGRPLPRRGDADEARPVPLLRGARALDPRLREPELRWPAERIDNALIVAVVVAVLAALALRPLRPGAQRPPARWSSCWPSPCSAGT